jgi:hypothetical protein
MYVLAYVDDLIIVSSSEAATTHLLHQLDQEFAIKDLGRLHYFGGIEVNYSSSGLVLSQKKYITELLTKMNMLNCRPVSTPLSISEKVSWHHGKPLSTDDVTNFCSTVGTLQYLMMTRTDLSFGVNKVCQFMQHPTDVHRTVVKRILRYLKFNIHDGLHITRSPSATLNTQILIGLAAWMIDDPRVVFWYIFALISSLGALRSKQPSRDPVLNQSTKHLLILQLR